MPEAKYREIDRETFLRRTAESQARRTGGEFAEWFKTPRGTASDFKRYKIRLMPPHVNMDDVFVETKMHFLPSNEIGKDGRPIPIGIGCLGVYGEECGACKRVDNLFRDAKTEDDPDVVKRIKRTASDQAAKLRFFTQLVDLDHPDKGVQRYACGPDVEKRLRQAFYDDEGQLRNITHPKTGRHVLLMVGVKAGTDFTSYEGTRAAESASALHDMGWLDAIEDLTTNVVKPTQEEMTLALSGQRPKREEKKPEKKPETKAKTEPKTEPKTEEVKKKPPRRQMVEDEDVPYAVARAAIKKHDAGIEPYEMTPEKFAEIIAKRNPPVPCFEESTNLNDEMCKSCRVLLPCVTSMLAKGESIAGPVDE